MIKLVKIVENIIEYDQHHELGYDSENGILIIEEDNGKRHILDLDSNTDISDSDYIDILTTRKTKENILFKNIFYDTELLEKFSRGKK